MKLSSCSNDPSHNLLNCLQKVQNTVLRIITGHRQSTAGYVGRFDSCSQAELARLGWPLILCSKVTAQCREFGHLDNVR